MNVTIGGIARTVEITSFDKLGDVKVCMLTTTADGSVGFQQLNQEVIDTIYASFPVDTSSGEIASFEDGADNVPVRKLTLNLVPYQGGSGDPAPDNVRPIYPNNGVNQWDEVWEVGGMTTDGQPSTSTNEIRCKNYIPAFPNTRYCVTTPLWLVIFQYDADKNFLLRTPLIGGDSSPFFTTLANTAYLKFYCQAAYGTTYKNDISINLPSTCMQYVPYNAIGITRTGKNLFDNAITNIVEGQNIALVSGNDVKNTSNSAWASVRYELELPKGSYTVSVGTITQSANNAIIQVAKYNGSYSELCVLSASNTSRTFTLNNANTIRVSLYSSIANNPFTVNNLQIENGTSATEYEPYQGERYYPISDNPVYGGTLEVETGVLTVDRGYVDLGDLSWGGATTNTPNVYRFQATLTGAMPNSSTSNVPDLVCSQYKAVSPNAAYTRNTGITTETSNAGIITIYDEAYATGTTGTQFKTAMSGVQLVYPLATPLVYQLTPVQVKTLLGYNNIWTDSGTVEVQYLANIGLYIQKIIGSSEDDMVANQNISANKYFFVGEELYYSTSAISAGQTIVVGTNCIKTNLADALNALNS